MLEYLNGASDGFNNQIRSNVHTILFPGFSRSCTSFFCARLGVVLIIDSQLAGRAYGRGRVWVSVHVCQATNHSLCR